MSVHYSALYMYGRIHKGTVTAPSYPLPAKMSTTIRSRYYRDRSITDQHREWFLFFFFRNLSIFLLHAWFHEGKD